jgi:hypothetical protein
MLDPLSSPECNAHLILFVMDAILITVFPELGELTDVNLVERYNTGGGSGLEKKEPELRMAVTGSGVGKTISHATNPVVQRSRSAGSVFTLYPSQG